MTWRDLPDAATLICAIALPVLASAFHDKSYIVVLSPISFIGAAAMVGALYLNRRWWILVGAPFLAIPFFSW